MTAQDLQALVERIKAATGSTPPVDVAAPPVEAPMMPSDVSPSIQPTSPPPLMQRAGMAAKEFLSAKAPSVPKMTNPDIMAAQSEMDQMNASQQSGGLKGLIGSAMKGLSYGGMDPSRAQQLQQNESIQADQQKQAKMRMLAERIKGMQDQDRQSQQDARQKSQDEMAAAQQQSESERNAQMFPIQLRGAEAQAKGAEQRLTAPDLMEVNPGNAVIDKKNPSTPLYAAPKPQAPDNNRTPFEVWQEENKGKPLSEWFKISATPSTAQPDYEWVVRAGNPMQIRKGSAQPGDRPYDAVAERTTSPDGPSPYETERADRTVAAVDALLGKVNGWTAGKGSILSAMPGTEARNFKAELDTLKSNIMMNELTSMRAASKTGGALGQVSDAEGKLLQSALGALDAGQSPENLTEQLKKVKESVTRWQQAQTKAPATPATPPAKPTNQPKTMILNGKTLTLGADGKYH